MLWLVIAVLLAALVGLLIVTSIPRLVSAAPLPGAAQAGPNQPLQLEFSRPVDGVSVSARLHITPTVAVRLEQAGARLSFAPQPAWPSGQTITVTLEAGATASGLFAMPALQSFTWHFQVRPVMLAYLWPANGLADIYALSLESGKIERLTQDAGARDFQAAADGQWIYYTADLSGGGSRILRFRRGEASDRPAQPELVFDCPRAACRAPALSRDGSFVAYERAPQGQASSAAEVAVWVLDLKTGQARQAAAATETTRFPRWSQDGWLLVYNQTRQVYQAFPPGGGSSKDFPNQVGDPGDWQPGAPAFAASEFFEEVQNLLDTTSSGHLMLYALANPAAPTDLTQANNIEDTAPVFSPDGSRLALSRKYLDPQRWTAGRQLWVMDRDGQHARALTNDPFYNYYDMAWSPDGRQIAVVRFNQVTLTDPPELWTVQADSGEAIQLVIGGFAPEWIP